MDKQSRPAKINKKQKKQLNIGIIVCVLIILYLVVNFCIYLFTNRIAVYEVTAGATASRFEGQYNALILREERLVPCAGTGYVSFFVGDATPIHVGQQTYVVDGTGEISQRLEEAAKDQSILSPENLGRIRSSLFDFDASFNTDHYYEVYNFKYKIESQILELINSSVFESINADLASLGENAYKIVTSDTSGIILHNIDNFEMLKPEDVESSSFNKANYQKRIIKTNDLLGEGDPVYKLVVSDRWNLVFQINHPEAFEGISNIDIEFLKDNVIANADFYMFTKSGNTYGVLTLDKYLIRYVTERFVQIALIDNTQEGIKVPKTSITEKQFYTIPAAYLSQGGNSSTRGFNKQVILEDGSTSIQFVTPNITRIIDDVCYVSTSEFSDGDVLVMNESDSRYQVGSKENLKGVFVSNGGYAIFKSVEIIGENNSFYILDPSKSQVSLFDQIVKNSSKVKENDIINR
ncbi:MAG: hypothetical protein J5483_00485 [Lachnospiraceae bacterium]|nr:hypothetical protein [Lachnospiraceae bacterium]